jgi:acyl-CoA thioester hydrolase
MTRTPVIFKTTHRVKFSDLDPYNHMRTALYSAYFVDHRLEGLRESIGWDLKMLESLPFMIWIRRLEIDFLRPAIGDQEITITSFVREFQGTDAYIECSMLDSSGRALSRCLMVVAYVDKRTNRSADWTAEAMAPFYEQELTGTRA